ncbi:branched-chain amino acid ABC transporter permease [Halostagnicola bangensis]
MSLRDVTGRLDIERPTLSWEYWDEIKGTESFVFVAATVFVLLWSWLFARAPITSAVGGYQSLAVTVLIWGIFAIGFDLLLGQTGLLSFGHAVFWGGGAYAAGLFSYYVTGDPLLVVIAGIVFALVLAAVVGYIALRRHAVYFAILTLAIGQFVYFLAVSPLQEITGGYNGFIYVQVEPVAGFINLNQPLPGVLGTLWYDHLYLFVAVFFVFAVVLATRIVKSPYGLVFRSLRENEQRAAFIGINVWRYKFMAFILSAVFAGVAGSLYTIHTVFVSVESLYWLISGEVVIMTVLGGLGSVFGPILGAILYVYVRGVVDGFPIVGPYWFLILTTLFTVVVWAFPQGLWGIVGKIGQSLRGLTRRWNDS